MELCDPGRAASGLFGHLLSEDWGQNYLSKRSLQGISKGSHLRNWCLACKFSLIKMNYSLFLPQPVLLSFKAQLFRKPLPPLSRVESLVQGPQGMSCLCHLAWSCPLLPWDPQNLRQRGDQARGRQGCAGDRVSILASFTNISRAPTVCWAPSMRQLPGRPPCSGRGRRVNWPPASVVV